MIDNYDWMMLGFHALGVIFSVIYKLFTFLHWNRVSLLKFAQKLDIKPAYKIIKFS